MTSKRATNTGESPRPLPTKDVEATYEYIEKLGEGAYGEVWKIRDRRNGEILALKVIFKKRLTPKGIFDLIKEVDILTNLSSTTNGCHPGIVCYRDIFNCGDRVCITMEFVEGMSGDKLLEDLMAREQGLPPDRLWVFMQQTLSALAYIHSKGVAHRDIKQDNVILTPDGRVVLIDFGFACFFEGITRSKDAYRCTGTAGTPDFYAPEVANKLITQVRDLWGKADVWSLGIACAEFALGRQFTLSIGQEIANGNMEVPPKLAYKDMTLANIINSMLTVNARQRPSAAALLKQLEAYPKPAESISERGLEREGTASWCALM